VGVDAYGTDIKDISIVVLEQMISQMNKEVI
jgi:hypothetical protein